MCIRDSACTLPTLRRYCPAGTAPLVLSIPLAARAGRLEPRGDAGRDHLQRHLRRGGHPTPRRFAL
eukprot:3042670-Prymnesium_polylepis.1